MIDNLRGIVTPDKPSTDAELPDRPKAGEVARWLRKSESTIYAWCRDGLIPCKHVGRSYLFEKRALLEWVKPEAAAD